MPFLVLATDHPGVAEKREKVRNEHRNYLKSYGNKILASGALLDDEKIKIIGGITLLDVENRDEAVTFEKDDPYSKAEIRKETLIIYWRKRWWDGEFQLEDE